MESRGGHGGGGGGVGGTHVGGVRRVRTYRYDERHRNECPQREAARAGRRG